MDLGLPGYGEVGGDEAQPMAAEAPQMPPGEAQRAEHGIRQVAQLVAGPCGPEEPEIKWSVVGHQYGLGAT